MGREWKYRKGWKVGSAGKNREVWCDGGVEEVMRGVVGYWWVRAERRRN